MVMRKKKFAYSIILFLLLSAMVPGFGYADDDDHEEDEEHYEYEEGEGENHEYEEEEGEYHYEEDAAGNDQPSTEESLSWQKWNRSSADWDSGTLFQQSSVQEMPLSAENRTGQIKAFEYKGQLMVESRKAAELLDAGYIGYETTGTAEVWKDGSHLIFKEGSHAVYENMKKTPMPAEVHLKNKELYVPVSVIANGLGYVIEGNTQTGISLIKE